MERCRDGQTQKRALDSLLPIGYDTIGSQIRAQVLSLMSKVTIKVEVSVDDAYVPEGAAKVLGKGEATIWRWLRDDKIAAVRIGGRTFIPRKEIERLQKKKSKVG